jgi:hypothetical protein
MTRKALVLSCIVTLCLATVSCQKLETAKPRFGGPMTYVAAKFPDAIPAEYGTLTGVSQNPKAPWTSLWFQKPDGTVTAVFVNVEQGEIFEKVLTIPRK